MDLQTQMAIGRFEEASGMPVTGEASLAIAAKISLAAQTSIQPAAGNPDVNAVDTSVADARQACLDEKKAVAESKKKKKKLWGGLAKAGGNMLGRFGGAELASDIYAVSATAEDVSAISNAMGLDEADVSECMQIGSATD